MKKPDKNSGPIERIIEWEIATVYTTPEQRTAYRAALSSAAMLCDQRARSVRAQNPGRKKGSASQVGEFGARIAQGCGDAIMAAREGIEVHASPKEEANAKKMAAVRKVLG